MTYLITGGSGFIGSHLTEYLLKNGHSVINVDNFDAFYDAYDMCHSLLTLTLHGIKTNHAVQ